MNDYCQYTIERYRNGWLMCSANGKNGIPMNALNECVPLFGRKSVMDSGIARHYREIGKREAVIAIGTPAGCTQWRNIIEGSIKHLPADDRWWYGCDVGLSSAALFAAITLKQILKYKANEYGKAATPQDSDDLSRCFKMLAEVGEPLALKAAVVSAYPETAWVQIMERWEELKAADGKRQCAILNECHAPKPSTPTPEPTHKPPAP